MSSPTKIDCTEAFSAATKTILNDFISHVNQLPDQLKAPNLEERQMNAFYADAHGKVSGQYDSFVKKYPQCRTGDVLDRRLAAYHKLNELKSEWLDNRRAPHEILGGTGSILGDVPPYGVEVVFAGAFAAAPITEAIKVIMLISPLEGGLAGAFVTATGVFYLPLAAFGAGGVAIQSLVNSNSDMEYVK